MKRKINIWLCTVGTLSILLTAVMLLGVFYNQIKRQVLDDLMSYVDLIEEAAQEIKWPYHGVRITLIHEDGRVRYDNKGDEESMENHAERPEVVAAKSTGEGSAIRKSDTFLVDTYYYARKLPNGEILRVSKEAGNIWRVFSGGIPVLFFSLLVLLGLCMGLSYYITGRLISPIEKLAIGLETGKERENTIYDELAPFVRTIKKQHKDIEKQIERLKQENERTRMITENMKEGFLMLDEKNNLLITNPSAISLLGGRKEKNYIGEHLLTLSRNEELFQCINHTGSVELELNGKILHLFSSAVMQKQKQLGTMCFILDVTETERNEQQRREFSASVSHELKTPLAAISGYAELIKGGIAAEKDAKRFAGEIHKNATRLLALIDDIIHLSKLDEGEERLQKTQFDLKELAQECVHDLQINADKREVELSFEGENAEIVADRGMIETLIINLCDNAIRYNKKNGRVIVKTGIKNGSGYLYVQDTGIGIPKEHQERIFERFYRVDKSRSKETGGTGLGLAIVKHIAKIHGAKIELTSKEEEGTTIIVWFL